MEWKFITTPAMIILSSSSEFLLIKNCHFITFFGNSRVNEKAHMLSCQYILTYVGLCFIFDIQ